MLIRFWGTRGSIPSPLHAAAVRAKVRAALMKTIGRTLDTVQRVDAFMSEQLDFATTGTFGGNSSCVQVESGPAGGDEYFILDAGTGLREFGRYHVATRGAQRKSVFNIVLSHVHWDHIIGFPFFAPAFVAGNLIRIHGCHPEREVLREAFARLMSAPCFPVEFDHLPAAIEFVPMEPARTYTIGGFAVRAVKQYHPSDSYGYRIEKHGKIAVYSTDSEHKPAEKGEGYSLADFFKNADLVIFDAQYSLAETIGSKEDWGHSSNIVGVELCQRAGAKHLCLFHHEPSLDDAVLQRILQETIQVETLSRRGAPLRISSAYDGLEISL